jgi:NADH-quinone oxidoreductase subunit E
MPTSARLRDGTQSPVLETTTVDAKVAEIVARYGGNRDSLIAILQDIQTEYSYLPEPCLRSAAAQLRLPLIQVYGVATFFKAFSLKPRGRRTATVCLGTACHVRGAPALLDEVKRCLGIEPGDTTDDMEFSLEAVNCLGACALGPIMVVDGEYHGQMTPGKTKKVLGSSSRNVEGTKHEEVEHGSRT